MLGKNKEPIKTPKKNIVPPFDDERWYPTSDTGVYDIKRNGYSISFRTTADAYHRMQYKLDIKLVAGKKLVFSVSDRTKGITTIQFNIQTESGWTYNGNTSYNTGTINIPSDAIKVYLVIQGLQVDAVHYVENFQLEIGEGATKFEEKIDVNKLPKRGLKFVGGSHVKGKSGYMNSEHDYSLEAEFTPLPPAISSTYGQEAIVIGWQGNHKGILYDRSAQSVRVQEWCRNTVKGTTERDYVLINAPFGRKVNVLVTFNANKREKKVYVNKSLVHTSTKFQDKEVYNHLANSSSLIIGAMTSNIYDFNGVVEVARYWNRTLSDDEVFSDERISYGLVDEYDFREQDVNSKTVKNTAGSYDATISSKDESCNPRYIQKAPLETSKKNLDKAKRKAPFKKYPFDFKRVGKATLGNVEFGMSQPRISSDGGIVVEDGYENIFPLARRRDFTNWYTNSGSKFTTVTGQKVEEWGATDATRITTSGGTGIVKYYTPIVAPSVAGQYHTLGVYVKNIGEYTVDVQDNLGSSVKVLPNETKWVSMTKQGNGGSNFQLMFCTLSSEKDKPLDFIAWRPQAINGEYLPTYTEFSRDKEYLAIRDIGEYFDNEKGSLELELTPLNGEGVVAKSVGYHDISYFNSGSGTGSGFIIRRNANYVEFVIAHPDGGHTPHTPSFSFKNGENIKYRLEWNRKENYSRLFINGSKRVDINCFPETLKTMSMFIGCREMNHTFNNGNAIYKSLRIRNRHGQTVYKL